MEAVKRMRRHGIGSVVFLIVMAASSAPLYAADDGKSVGTPPSTPAIVSSPLLDTGFHQLYELNFRDARGNFLSYQQEHADDPLGEAAEAASYLFEQFNTKGIFSSAFFLNDSKFLNGADGTPAQNRNEPFLTANARAREMARQQLKANPSDTHALLVLAMTDGMEADYDALIIKKQLAGLGLTKQAEGEATKLLAIDPTAEDAYLALGAANYVIGCLPGYKRAFLWFGGVHGDRTRGMEQLQRTADHGHYLRPFAKILLALAAERERQTDRARQLLTDLANEFPGNPLFAHELSLIDETVEPCRLTTPC